MEYSNEPNVFLKHSIVFDGSWYQLQAASKQIASSGINLAYPSVTNKEICLVSVVCIYVLSAVLFARSATD